MALPPGISGSLLSGSYASEPLAQAFAGRLGEASSARACRALERWVTRVERSLGPASSIRAVLDAAALPLLEILGYDVDRAERRRELGFVLHLVKERQTVALALVLPWGGPIEAAWLNAVRAGIDAHLRWTLAVNGTALGVFDAARTWSRRLLAIDLRTACRDERGARLVWALARADALAPGASGPSLLDLVTAASDRHASRVCASLGHGVLDALQALLVALDAHARRHSSRPIGRDAPRARAALFEQGLTIVYRVLFLLFAEARGLVPTWHRVYAEAYAIESLCRRLTERAAPRGIWDALQAIARLLHEGCRAGDLHVTAFNGRLFAPRHAPLADRVHLPDRVAAQALLALSTTPARTRGEGRRRIDYADLGVEQLGAVYERVLEYEAVRADAGLQLARTSPARKSTGSFYTPRALTDFLVRRTLAPLVADRSAADILSLRVVDPAMGSGAFLVAACRYLAAAAERALLAEGTWRAAEIDEPRRAALRRQVAERCLYGVDINPTAVQVARLSLWLHTLAAERPLSFLDHHLIAGDSLVGARLVDLARPLVASRRTHVRPPLLDLFDEQAAPALASAVPERFRLALEASDTLAAVRDKERRLAALESSSGPLAAWRMAADIWCAARLTRDPRFTPGVVADLMSHVLGRGTTLPTRQVEALLGRALTLAREKSSFHWELVFPEVFFEPNGERRVDAGFDAVIGNPPWDMVRADTGDRNARTSAREKASMLVRFVRDAGVYTLSGSGHPNQYQLFLERARQLLRTGGRFGLVLPSGLAADHGSAHLRRALLSQTMLDPIVGFENRRAIFPIHRSTRFLLVSGTNRGETVRLRGRFGLDDVAVLDRLADRPAEDPAEAYPIGIHRDLIARWDPVGCAFPEVTDPRDVSIVASIAERVPPLGDPRGWGVRFGRELNASDDRPHFVAAGSREASDLLPIVEGKHVEPFRVALDAVRFAIPRPRARRLVDPAETYGRARLAYRDVAGRTNRLTLIAALLPAGTLSTHTLFCSKTALDRDSSIVLLGLLNSLVANYLVRLRVSTHVTTAIAHALPVPRPARDSRAFRALVVCGERLMETGIAGDPESYATLNALAASLYGLDEGEFAHVVRTYPLIEEAVRNACLAAFGRARPRR